MSDSDNPVTLHISEGLATIQFNRPDHGNALSLPLVRLLAKLVTQVAEDLAVRCVLLTGSGRFFCVGGDIGAFREAGDQVPALLDDVTLHMHAAIAALADMDKPLVVAVNGPAAGAGLGFAIAGDIVIAARSAHFSMAYTAIGLTPDGGTSAMLPRLIGLRRAQEMALTNRRVSAEEAVAIGMVTRLIDDADLQDEARAVATTLAQGPTRAFGTVKRLLAAGYHEPLTAHLWSEARAISSSSATNDGKEGVAAFFAKRKPDFSGT